MEPAIAPQEVDHWAVRGRLGIGCGLGLEESRAHGRAGAEEFSQEPGLANARLADNPHRLAPARSGLPPALFEDSQFLRTAYEPAPPWGDWRGTARQSRLDADERKGVKMVGTPRPSHTCPRVDDAPAFDESPHRC